MASLTAMLTLKVVHTERKRHRFLMGSSEIQCSYYIKWRLWLNKSFDFMCVICQCKWTLRSNGVFTLASSGTGTRTGTGTRKNGLYGFKKNLSHYTWTGTGKNTRNIFRTWRMSTRPILQVLKMFLVMNTSVLPYPCSGAVWKVLIKTIIQLILGGPSTMWKVLHDTHPGPCSGSGPSQCEYTISWWIFMNVFYWFGSEFLLCFLNAVKACYLGDIFIWRIFTASHFRII